MSCLSTLLSSSPSSPSSSPLLLSSSSSSSLEQLGEEVPESLCGSPDTEFQNRERFYDIIRHPFFSFLFFEFLNSIQSSELLSFFLEVENYKHLNDQEQLKKKSQELFEKYLQTEEIEVESHIKSRIESLLEAPTNKMFESSQHQVLLALEGDSLPKFLEWGLFLQCSADVNIRRVYKKKIHERMDKDKLNIILSYLESIQNR